MVKGLFLDIASIAILAKAFKGELVEQLPSDGDAKDLLVQIQKPKQNWKKPAK